MADKEPPRLAQTKEGYAVFKHPILPDGKDCRTWYKVVGELPSKRPLLLLHGGPGGGHKSFMQCFDMYAEKTGTPVIYYDQLGCGNSTRLPEKKGDKLFWTPSLFVAELDNLVRHLGIRSGFDLLGQSWGAILAARYAISTEQKGSGLNKIIMSAGFARIRDAIQSVEDDIAAMPQQTQDIIHRCIAEGREDEYKYQLAFWEWCKKRMSTIIPRPKAGEIVFASFMPDDVVYSTMVGKDPFHMNQGNLRSKLANNLYTLTNNAIC